MKNIVKYLLATSMFFILTLSNEAQNMETLVQKQDLARRSAGWIEGYSRFVKGTSLDYHSLRQEITRALLVRATDGTMTAEWESVPVPFKLENKKIGVLWLAGLDLNHGIRHFTLSVNGVSSFSFTGGGASNWEVKGENGSKLSFASFVSDQHGDGFGYMWMILPEKMVVPGSPLRIKVTGAAENSTAWYMTFQAPDALHWLQQEATHEFWMNVRFDQGSDSTLVNIQAPPSWYGKSLEIIIQHKSVGGCLMKNSLTTSQGTFFIPSQALFEDRVIDFFLDKKPVMHLPGYGFSVTLSQLGEKTLVMNTGTWEGPGKWLFRSRTFYRPELFDRIKALSDSEASQGTIFLMNSSHQDIAWMDSPEKCIIERDTMLLTPLIQHAKQDSLYRFDIEDALMLREYLGRHPGQKNVVDLLLRQGRISVGASYNMPYEDMYSGESLLRQFYLGKRWLEKQFPGYQAHTYWNVDVPGRTPQMPQIMKGSGVNNLVISRQKMGVYRWIAPDSSFVTTFSPGHYSLAYPALNKEFFDAASFLANYSQKWIQIKDTLNHPAIPLLSDWDMSPAHDYRPLIRKWTSLQSYTTEDGEIHSLKLPPFRQVLAGEFFKNLNPNSGLNSIMGERPDVWLYIHGPSHQKALKASREADILLPEAEKFATIAALLNGSFSDYPEKKLTQAWEAKIYPDHGWGGKHGDITDRLFLEKFEQSKSDARRMLQTALLNISGRIATKTFKGRPVVVFNDLSWIRDDPVKVLTGFDKGAAKEVLLKDDKGRTVPSQLSEKVYYEDGSLKQAQLNFVAEEIPSIGYKTFYLQEVKDEKEFSEPKVLSAGPIENPFYLITLGKEGVKQIFDKELQANLLDTREYGGGEVVLLESVGNGAGEFADVQQPGKEFIDRTGNYQVKWKIEEDGPVYSLFSYRQPIKHAIVLQQVKVYKSVKRIDFETSLLNWDGTLYREYRELFPLIQQNKEITYEVPYGRVRVGKDEIQEAAGERYIAKCPEIHPRSILNWISVSGQKAGVTLSSSVVVWDYKDPLQPDSKQTVLQPILLASRRSCHGEGNEYLQTGDHYFRFTFTSHEPGWTRGWKQGVQANHLLQVVVDPQPLKKANLPEALSFFSTKGSDVNITAIKRQEDGNGFVVRWVEPEGQQGRTILHTFFPIASAALTNLLEQDPVFVPMRGDEVSVTNRSFEIKTLQLTIKQK